MRKQEQQHVGGPMAAQVVHDRVDPLRLGRQPELDLLQEVHPIGGAAPGVGPGEGVPGGGAEGAEDVALAAPAVVDLLLGATRGRVRPDPHRRSTGVTLGALGAHLVETND